MKRLAIILTSMCIFLSLQAQENATFRFGYLSYEAALKSMPDYTIVEFPKTILQKRQTELQELLDKNLEFKEHSRMELEKAEQDLMAPLKIRLIEVLGNIGRQCGYAFIVDTDVKALPFINPAMGIDLNQQVQDALK